MPSEPPAKRSPPAVVSMPLFQAPVIGTCHAIFCATGSQARMKPFAGAGIWPFSMAPMTMWPSCAKSLTFHAPG